MDRKFSFFASSFSSVRLASGTPVECVLYGEYERVGGESGVDAADRRAVFEDAFLWFSADDMVAQPAGVWRQCQAGGAADAGDGIAGDVAGPSHEPSSSGTHKVPVFIAWNGDWSPLRGMERRHHVHSHATRIYVSDGGDGLVQPLRDCMGCVQQYGERILYRSVETCVEKRAANHFQHRPGQPVYERRIHGNAAPIRRANQHGWTWPGVGQCVHRTVVAQREIRRHLSTRLSRWTGVIHGADPVFPLLQLSASTQCTRQSYASQLPQSTMTTGKNSHRFGAVPLRPCPTGSPPTGGHGLRSTPPKRTTPASCLNPPSQPAKVRSQASEYHLYYYILI